ncbi:hypothetical protein RND81_06G001600 [Saponaria officinalis]|uniref:Uncharacterized protein n=1 Tax=Saponaria officinalis TaxID=3572 RepID=A0AAW1K528_SAPOF
MQQQMVRHEDVDQEELHELKAELSVAERDKTRAFEELRETKLRLGKISADKNDELSSLKEALDDAIKDVKSKEKTIQSLQAEVDKFKQFESKLSEKDDALNVLKEQLSVSQASASQSEGLISDCRKKVEELEAEVDRRKKSEDKLFDSFVNQKNQIQEVSSLIEKYRLEASSLREKIATLEEERRHKDEASNEYRLEITSLREKIEALEDERRRQNDEVSREHKLETISLHEKIKTLEEEMTQKDNKASSQQVKATENGVMVVERGKYATIETKTLLNEVDFLKTELKRAMEAEETKDKALEDLALALKEVASESSQAKEKLGLTQQQLETVKEEAVSLKKMNKSTEAKYEALLKELKRENDRLTNIVNRLRLEAEDSLLAWSGKEIEFVKCIKKAENEKNLIQVEYNKLMQSLREAEEISEKSKEESKNLRDILKQALNEANVAKEAASLARTENSYLKDSLAEKDKALISLAQETERLRISEAEANESIKELKRVITSGSKKEVAKLEKESKELKKVGKKEAGADTPEKEVKERKLSSTFSFDLNQFWPSLPGLTAKPSKELEEENDKDDALGGSIFDLVETPERDSPPCHRRTSSGCSSTDDDTNMGFENFDEDAHYDDMDAERNSHGKKKALLRRFGDLLKRKNSHPPKDSPHPTPPKDSPHPPSAKEGEQHAQKEQQAV